MGKGCSVHFDKVTFQMCTLVVVGEADAILSQCNFIASSDEGTGIGMMVSGHGSRVIAQEGCSFKGGLQCVAVHAGASFRGHSVCCRAAEVTGIEVMGHGSSLTLSRTQSVWGNHGSSCKISKIHSRRKDARIHSRSSLPPVASAPQHLGSVECGYGLLIHKGTSTDVADTNVTQCVVGVFASCGDASSCQAGATVLSSPEAHTQLTTPVDVCINLSMSSVVVSGCRRECFSIVSVSYTHLTLPTTPYV